MARASSSSSSPLSLTVMMRCTLLLCFITMAVSRTPPSALDCSKIPIENLEPCMAYLTNWDRAPTSDCCNGATSWLSYPSDAICKCYKENPRRLTFKPNHEDVDLLKVSCLLGDQFIPYQNCLHALDPPSSQ